MTDHSNSIIEAVGPLLREGLVPAAVDSDLLILDVEANQVVRVACVDASIDDVAEALSAHGMLAPTTHQHDDGHPGSATDVAASLLSRRRILQGAAAAGVVGITVLALPTAAMAASALAPPGNVTATAGEESVVISWEAVAGITYQVLVKVTGLDDNDPNQYIAFGMPVANSPRTVTGLTAGTSYSFVVRASDGVATSPDSAVVTATPTATTPGSAELAFAPNANNAIFASVVQADGKIIIGGTFTSINGVLRNRIARLNANGTLDTTFTPANLNNIVRALALDANGKVLVGGGFTIVDDEPLISPATRRTRERLCRLNTNGTLDTTFNPGAFGSTVFAIVVQGDGKIVVGGQFSASTSPRERLARLTADGTVDSTFPTADSTVRALAVQTNGQILVGGAFANITVGGTTTGRAGIARINANGTLDTFNPGISEGGNVFSINDMGTNGFLVGGRYSTIAGTARTALARFLANGNLDTTFNPNLTVGAGNIDVFTTRVDSIGRVLLGGIFSGVNGLSRVGIARLNSNGTTDTDFDSSVGGPAPFVQVVVPQAEDKVIIGGDFLTVGGASSPYIARLNT
jgi:uncharacterized delta-60 repeat protein